MPVDDRAYFEERAEIELQAAEASEHPDAVRAHYLLAGYYLDRVHGDGDQPPPLNGKA
jgi:hypothetical protein